MQRKHPVVAQAVPFLALLLAGACAPASEAAADPAADEEAVRAELDARRTGIVEALTAGDADASMDYWTADMHTREPGFDMGREAYDAFVREVLSNGRVLALDIRPDEVFVHGDAAYETGEYDETVEMAGEEPMTLRNFYALRWERGADGVWRIDRFLGAPREAPAEM